MPPIPENDLIKFFFCHMSSKGDIGELLLSKNIRYRESYKYEQLAELCFSDNKSLFNLAEITDLYRQKRSPIPKDTYIEYLTSGHLVGHSWHQLKPSYLHLGFQEMVRDCLAENGSLEDFLARGTDIARHEFFMTVTHDLCEYAIIELFPESIPATRYKSISDFVFGGVPYDLKRTNYINGETKRTAQNNKKQIAQSLIANADTSRIRRDAIESKNGWGLNRFYILVEEQERWLDDPNAVLEELYEEMCGLDDPMILSFNGIDIYVQLVAI